MKLSYWKYAILCIVGILHAYPLCSQISKDWLSKNDRGNRFEGTYDDRDIGRLSIELLSFTGQKQPYNFGEQQVLNVRFFNPDHSKYQLNAREIRTRKFYWMQDKNTKSEKGWNQFVDWPVDYKLRSLGIGSRNLGLLVRLGEKNKHLISPAYVSVATDTSDMPKQSNYLAYFVLGTSVSNGKYRIYKGKERNKEALIYEKKLGAKSGGSPFPIFIRGNLLPEESWFTLELNMEEMSEEASPKSVNILSYECSFYHKKIE